MDTTYLYIFGYQTPDQRNNKLAHGWNDLDSSGFFIRAESKEAARAWGDTLANTYVRILHNDSTMTLRTLGCAGVIEEDQEMIRLSETSGIPVVAAGTRPDMDALIEKKYGRETWWRHVKKDHKKE